MYKKIKNININYEFNKLSNKETIVFLHGWGQNIEMMNYLAKPLAKEYQTLIIDLPGFGNSEEPNKNTTLDEYVEIVKELLTSLNIKNPTLVGHSFGGKISLLYASKYEVNKLIVLASPFKKEIQELTLKVKILKTMKKLPLLKKLENYAKSKIGSTDYKNSSPVMRNILVNHINYDITEYVSKIKCPTILIWGTRDDAVPVERGQELEKLIPGSALITYENCTHYAYIERLLQTVNIIKSFLGDD